MNLLWVIGLTIIVAIEKLAPGGPLLGRAAGAGLIAWGLVRLAL
jgi:predicted metal-binding membrane protein